MFLLPDGTFWVQLVNFAIFYAILNLVFLRPVQRAIAKRREYIDSLTSDYDKAQAEAANLRAEAVRIRQDARREADQLLAQARSDAGNEAAAITAEYAERAARIADDARRAVSAELDSAREQGTRIAGELAQSIAAKVFPEVRA